MNSLDIKNYNFEHTLLGGQAFNWDFINGAYYGFTQDKIIKIIDNKNHILWQTYPENDDLEFITNYLNLDYNYERSLFEISEKDEYIKNAIEKYKGLRLLNQEFEQTLLSFILSSHKSVKGVRKAVRDLSNKYGKPVIVDNLTIYLFPKANDLIKLSEEELRAIGFGFRAKYFKAALEKLVNSKDVSNLDEHRTREYLTNFTGIGEKIADCIMTFSLGFKTVTPLDIWGKRVLTEYYKVDPKMKYSEMRKWYSDYFKENTSIAGQYLFEYIRHNKASKK